MTSEQQEEERPARHKPMVVKLRAAECGPRLKDCPAYPTTGPLAGASVEWCRENRGRMAACDTCLWRKT